LVNSRTRMASSGSRSKDGEAITLDATRETHSVRAERTWPAAIPEGEKIARALDLRCKGYAYSEIGTEMGIEASEAFRLVDEALTQVSRRSLKMVRKLELARLDEMQRGVYEKAASGDLRAIKFYLKISERRGLLAGADAIAKHMISEPPETEKTDEELRRDLIKRIERLAEADRLNEQRTDLASWELTAKRSTEEES